MKRKLSFSIIVILLSILLAVGLPAPPLAMPVAAAPIVSPSGWEWQNPLPQGNRLYGV